MQAISHVQIWGINSFINKFSKYINYECVWRKISLSIKTESAQKKKNDCTELAVYR